MAESGASPLPPFPLWRSRGVLTGVMVVALSAAVVMLGGLGLVGQLAPAMASAGMAYLAALAALEPMGRASRLSPQQAPVAGLLAIGIRLGGTVLGVAMLLLVGGFEPVPVAGWTLGWYLLLLVVEVVIFARYLGRWQGQPTGARPDRAGAESR